MNWRVLAIAIVFIQLAAIAAIGAAVGYRYLIPVFGYWSAALGIAIIGTGLYSIVALAGIARRREPEPAKALIALVLRCDLPLVAFLVGTQLALLAGLRS